MHMLILHINFSIFSQLWSILMLGKRTNFLGVTRKKLLWLGCWQGCTFETFFKKTFWPKMGFNKTDCKDFKPSLGNFWWNYVHNFYYYSSSYQFMEFRKLLLALGIQNYDLLKFKVFLVCFLQDEGMLNWDM